MLVCLHGFTETDEPWQDLLSHSDIPYRCMLLPGHGHRPCSADEDMAHMATTIAAELPDDPIDLVGYSMGGRIALRVALDFPERIRSLILISCTPGVIDDAARSERAKVDEALAEVLEEDGIGAFVAYWERHPIMATAKPMDPQDEEDLRSRRLNNDPIGLACALRSLGQGAMEPLWDRLNTLSMPCLLVSGSVDTKYDELMRDMVSRIPKAKHRSIPVCGHAVHREQPEALLEYIKTFIDKGIDKV